MEGLVTEYTVHFQKGTRVGTRSLRMEHVEADNPTSALVKAKHLFPDWREQRYRVVRVDHFDGNHIVIDY
jgi:hypothetical protein